MLSDCSLEKVQASRGFSIKGEKRKWWETYGAQLERWQITHHERGTWRHGKERRVREINCPRLCPHPVVCLHQSSAERADRTGGEEGSEEEEEEEGGCASRWRRKGE